MSKQNASNYEFLFAQSFLKVSLFAFITTANVSSLDRSSHRRCSTKKVFLEKATTLLKKSLWLRCFPVNFAKFLRTPFLQNTYGRLLLFTPVNLTAGRKQSLNHAFTNETIYVEPFCGHTTNYEAFSCFSRPSFWFEYRIQWQTYLYKTCLIHKPISPR